ncbi:uncharacterized protein LOC113794486 [Dermatophagoides pteronyssinus]|uniref:uncharacterized protein LOC113794486 n=1 Tax=Dermatophagoides pteronyssinus TaxID=6956 RepID=UPI003F67257F
MTKSKETKSTKSFGYFLEKAKKIIEEKDYPLAKSYLMVAGAMDKDNFLIKIELYRMAKLENDYDNAYKNFTDLFYDNKSWNKLTDDSKRHNLEKMNGLKDFFIEEMKCILFSISDQWRHCLKRQDFEILFNVDMRDTKFYYQLWKKFQVEHRINFITKFCSFYMDKIEQLIDLYLFILIHYHHENVIQAAIALIKIIEKFSQDFEPNIQEYLREKYIFHVMPVLFSSQYYYKTFDETVLEKHFLLGLKYYIEDFLDDSKENIHKKRPLLEKKLIELVTLIGDHKKWKVFSHENPLELSQIESNLDTLSTYTHKCFCRDNEVLDLSLKLDSSDYRKIGFYSIVLFTILFCRSMSKIGDRIICEKLSGYSDGKAIAHLNLKKRKLMNYAPCLIASDKDLITDVQLLLKFNVSIDFIKQEFNAYIAQIGLNKNYRFLQYKICHALHEADYHNAMQILKNFEYRDIVNNNFSNLLYWLQYYIQYLTLSIKLNQSKDAAVFIIKIIDLLCSSVSSDSGDSNITFGYQLTKSLMSKNANEKSEINYCNIKLANEYHNSRQMIFLCPTLENVIGLLIDATIILLSSLITDFTIGHIMVLSQYQWPYFYPAFIKTMMIIRTKTTTFTQQQPPSTPIKPTFIYPLFSSYIFESDIIEEFQALVNDQEYNFQLEPMITVFKNNQEISDLLLNMMKQTSNSNPQIDLFVTFLVKEIKPFLAGHLVNQ